MAIKEDRRARWKKSHPWVRYVEWARRRCNDRKSKWFKFYGAKGIICSLNGKEAGILWARDNAHLLKRPSLDRKNSHLGYTFDNCQFIEFDLNARIAWDPKSRPIEEDIPDAMVTADERHEPEWVQE